MTGAASGLFSVARQTGASVGVAATTAVIGGDVGHGARGHALIAIAAALAAIVWWAAARP
jgi:hypothetical protein